MADIAKVKRNIGRMIDGGATEAEIDMYLSQEGVSIEQLKAPAQLEQEAPERKKVFSGALLPLSRYSDDSIEFDSDAGIVGSMKRVVQAPADVLSGKLDPMSDEGSMRALEMATAISPAPLASKSAAPLGFLAPRQKVPTRAELKSATDQGYKAARDLGAEYDANAVASWARETVKQLNKEGRIAETYPEVHGLLRKLSNPPSGGNPTVTLEVIDALYKELGRLGGATETHKASAANIVQKSLDDFHANLGPEALSAGTASPQAAAQILKEARGNAAAGFRSDKITGLEKTIERRTAAAGSGRNMDNQIRQRLTTFIESRKGSRGLTKAEAQAIDDVIMGKPSKNALRYFGNLMGGGGGIMSTAQMMGAAGAGSFLMGPAGLALGAIPPTLGAMARQAGGAIGKKEVKNLDKMMRARSPLYQKRLGNDMPPQAAGAPPTDVPLLPSPSPSQGAPVMQPSFGPQRLGKAGMLSIMNEQNRQEPMQKPVYGGLLKDGWI